MQSIAPQEKSLKKSHYQTELRAVLSEHLTIFEDPILAALQGIGLSALEVAVIWIDLEEQVSKVYSDALFCGESPNVALDQANGTRQELAARLIAARKGW